jgi:cytochrome c5
LEANAAVIVSVLPPAVEKFLGAPAQPAAHSEHVSNSCTACHSTGIRNAPVYPEDHAAYQDENCIGCHKLQK